MSPFSRNVILLCNKKITKTRLQCHKSSSKKRTKSNRRTLRPFTPSVTSELLALLSSVFVESIYSALRLPRISFDMRSIKNNIGKWEVNICHYYLSRSDKKSTEVNVASDDDTLKDSFVTNRELYIDSRIECGDE